MLIVLTNRELLSLYEAAKRAAELKTGLQCAYAIARNICRLEKDCETLTQTFNRKRQSIIEAHCLRDESGKPVIINNEYQFNSIDRINFDKEMLKLQQDTEELLNATVEVELQPIKLVWFPEEIEPWIVKGLLPVITEAE